MSDKELFQRLVKKTAARLGVPKNQAIVMMIAAATTLSPGVIRILAEHARTQKVLPEEIKRSG